MAELIGEQWQTALHNEVVIAGLLDCKIKTLQKWRVTGDGPPFVRVGRLVRYRQADVEAWINSRRVSSTSEAVR